MHKTAQPSLRLLVRTFWLTLTYWLVGILLLRLGFATDYALPIWPPAGLGVGMLLVYHRTAILPILIASFLTDLYLDFSLDALLPALLCAIAATLQAWIGYRLTRNLLKRSSALIRDKEIFSFLLLAGPLACLTSSTLGVIVRVFSEHLATNRILNEWLIWWSGDTLGVLLFAPLTLLLLSRRHRAHEASLRIGTYRIALPLLGTALLLGSGHLLLTQIQEREARFHLETSLNRFSQLSFAAVNDKLAHLESVAQLIRTRPTVTEQEFSQFAHWLIADPALISLDWAPLVPASERYRFEQQQGRPLVQPDGTPEASVTYIQALERSQYFPVVYSIPHSRTTSLRGLDHGWDPMRHAAITRALETGQVQLLHRPSLTRTDADTLLAFQPVPPLRGTEQSTASPGVIVGVFDLELLLAPLLKQAANHGLALRIINITQPAQPQVLTDRIPADSPIFKQQILQTREHRWQLDATLLAPPHTTSGEIEQFYLLFSILAAILAAYTTLSIAERNLATQLTVQRRTRDLNLELKRRLEAEAGLRSSESRYRQLFQHSPFATLILRHDQPVDFNNASQVLLDTDNRQALLDNSLLERIHPKDRLQVERLFHEAAASFEPVRLDKVGCRTFSGHSFTAELTAVSCEFDGAPAVLCMLQDISARVKAEEEFERFFTSSLDLLCIADTRGYLRRINPAFKETLGWTEEELLSQPFIHLVHPDDVRFTRSELSRLEIDAETLHFENRFRCRDGRYRWIEWRALPQPNGLIFASAHDTTERHESTEKLTQLNTLLNRQVQEIQQKNHAIRAKETELNTLLNNLLECVITINAQGEIASANSAVETVFGYRVNELIGQNVSTLIPEPDSRQHDHRLSHHMKTAVPHFIGTSRKIQGRHKDGHPIPLELTVTEYQVNGETMFAGTLHDISEQKAMISALTTARDEAERANRAKSTFLATMSHEIRTPMNGVVGLIEVLEQTRLSEQQRQLLNTIRDSANSLLSLIDDILDFSKIEAGRLELDIQPFNLVELIENLCGSLVPVALKKNVDLSLFIDPALPGWVLSDPSRLRQLLYNLIGNAIKFCSGREDIKGRVSVRASFSGKDPMQLKVRIADNGIGISPEQQQQLFAPFTQAEASTTRRYGGTGLGLAICKHLVDLMGGDIRLISEPDVGTVFILGLSIRPAAAPESAPLLPDLTGTCCFITTSSAYNSDDLCRYLEHAGAETILVEQLDEALSLVGHSDKPCVLVSDQSPDQLPEQVCSLRLERGLRRRGRARTPGHVSIDLDALGYAEFIQAVALAAERTAPVSTFPPGKAVKASPSPAEEIIPEQSRPILVAEDDRVNQMVILQQLSLLGYTADMADDGRQALAMWQKGDYALLLTDLHMPHMDGYTLATEIRQQEAEKGHIPIIALTANALRGESNRALKQGMDAYLVKPVRLELLKQTLKQWLTATPSGEATMDTQPPTPSPVTEPLDLDILRDLVGSDPGLMRELLTLWQSSSAPQMEELHSAWQEKDADKVGSLAHRFKSSSGSIGAQPLGDLCADLETACRDQDHDRIAELVQQLEPLYRKTDSAITTAMTQM